MKNIRETSCADVESILLAAMAPEQHFAGGDDWVRGEMLAHIVRCARCEAALRAAKVMDAASPSRTERRHEWEARMLRGIRQRVDSPDARFRELVAEVEKLMAASGGVELSPAPDQPNQTGRPTRSKTEV